MDSPVTGRSLKKLNGDRGGPTEKKRPLMSQETSVQKHLSIEANMFTYGGPCASWKRVPRLIRMFRVVSQQVINRMWCGEPMQVISIQCREPHTL